MGKPTAKKKDQNQHQNQNQIQEPQKPGNAHTKLNKPSDHRASKAVVDEDTAIFINMSQELKEEGNKLFQKRDHEGAMLKYEKALKLLPKTHIDVAHLHSNMASCYMQMGLGEYPRAINECNLALEVSPRYSKGLLKRAKCYEALNRLDLALRDVNAVLGVEPNNLNALEILEGLRKVMSEKGVVIDEKEIDLDSVELASPTRVRKVFEKKVKKKKKGKKEETKPEVKAVMEENISTGGVKDKEVISKTVVKDKTKAKAKATKKPVKVEKAVVKTVKLVFGEDIRWGQLPPNCSMRLVRKIVKDRFPCLKGVLVKYRDREGDLVTITTIDELRLAESLSDPQGSFKLYVAEISADQEPVYEGASDEDKQKDSQKSSDAMENGDIGKVDVEIEKGALCVEDWILQFARLFKNHVGFDSDSYLDLHELGTKLHSEAMEDVATSDDAQELFDMAADKFQEMSALALFNWGNVHMSKARKRVTYPEDASKDSIVDRIKIAYEWARKEYMKAEKRYEESLKVKPDFYEGYLALGQQQFEQAKLCWYYSIGTKTELQAEPSSEVLQLYNKAEDSMERGMLMWEEMEEQRLNGISKGEKHKAQLQKVGLDGLFKEVSAEEAAERASNMTSQIYLLWGTLLYERSVVEYKLGLPTWEECLEVSVEKFELAGASPTDIAVMIKNHCSNVTALEGLGFKIDEIVQAWNEMYDAQRWQFGVPSFRLEPLFRRQVPKLHSMLEHV